MTLTESMRCARRVRDGLYLWRPSRRTSGSGGSGRTSWRTTRAARAGRSPRMTRWLAPNLDGLAGPTAATRRPRRLADLADPAAPAPGRTLTVDGRVSRSDPVSRTTFELPDGRHTSYGEVRGVPAGRRRSLRAGVPAPILRRDELTAGLDRPSAPPGTCGPPCQSSASSSGGAWSRQPGRAPSRARLPGRPGDRLQLERPLREPLPVVRRADPPPVPEPDPRYGPSIVGGRGGMFRAPRGHFATQD